MISLSFYGERQIVYSELNSFIEDYTEYFSKSDHEKLYEILKKKIEQHILDKEIYKEFLDSRKSRPYWERLEGLFDEKNLAIIEKEDYEKIAYKYKEIILRTIRNGLGLEDNEEDAWIENFKNAIEIHEISDGTWIDLKRKLRESEVSKYGNSLSAKMKLYQLYVNWYQKNNHTFLTDRKKYATSINDYLYDLKEYHYLMDENNKKIIREELLKSKLDFDDREDESEIWVWVKEQIKRYL
jgi:hypothetical protein